MSCATPTLTTRWRWPAPAARTTNCCWSRRRRRCRRWGRKSAGSGGWGGGRSGGGGFGRGEAGPRRGLGPPQDVNRALVLESRGPGETRRLGARLGRLLRSGDTVLLSGDLGGGKTGFVEGIARGG